MTRHTHGNSVGAYNTTDFGPRERVILEVFARSAVPLTDREVLGRLGLTDMNAVRPRITTLTDHGMLREEPSVKCPVTGKTVRTSVIAVPLQMAVA